MPTTADAVRMRGYWRKMPDRRTVSFSRRTAVGPPSTYGTAFNVTNVWHREFTNRPHAFNPGVYVVYSAAFYAPKEPNTVIATTAPPVPGDRLADASAATVPYTGLMWYVDSVEEAGSLGCWLLKCVSPAIISAVALSIQIQSPVESTSSSGLRVVSSWTTVSTQSAFVQLTPTEAADYLARRSIRKLGKLYLPVDVAVTAQHTVLVVATSERYTITRVTPPADLASMQEIDLEIIP